jgi:site-specific recombinase XerD
VRENHLKTREDPEAQEPLFLSERGGGALSLRTMQATIQELARRAKITRLPVCGHTCRHSFALAFLRRNPGKLLELAALLGHESLDTTAVYVQPSPEDLARAVEGTDE